jgi:DNA-binding LacI/PurR family transcriptional regulator
MGSGKPTSFDIAYHAGVSQATVSRALRDSPLVNAETKRKVQEVARKLNYQVDQHAAALRSQRSNTIALLLFEDPTTDDSQINPFFLSMLSNITRAAARHDYDVLVSFQQLNDDWHTKYELSNRADGIILLGYGDYVSYRQKLEHLKAAGAHFIIWGPAERGQPGHSLCSDNAKGAFDATRHLITLGRRNIAFLGLPDRHFPEFRRRYKGYRRALKEAGIPVRKKLQLDANNLEDAGHCAVQRLLESGETFDAVFAASDLIAIGAMATLTDNGLKVPDDIAVVGFDDIPAASYASPPLTTVHQDTVAAGKSLVEQLIRLIEGEEVAAELLVPKLKVRASCGATL